MVSEAGVIKVSMLRPIREKVGLGNLPFLDDKCQRECVNTMLKMKVDYKRNDLPVFLEKVKELIQEQDEEVKKAVIGRGKYVVNSEFKKFVKTEDEWFVKMKEAERVRHLQRFSSFKLPETSQISLSLSGLTGSTSFCSNTDGPCSSSNFTLYRDHQVSLALKINLTTSTPLVKLIPLPVVIATAHLCLVKMRLRLQRKVYGDSCFDKMGFLSTIQSLVRKCQFQTWFFKVCGKRLLS